MSWQQKYAKPGPYITNLPTQQEAVFQQWVRQNNIPFDPGSQSDYDMRGYWQGYTGGDPRAQGGLNPYDKQWHFPDTWKTPFHQGFSAESIYAQSDAPRWLGGRFLVQPQTGRVRLDEVQNPHVRQYYLPPFGQNGQ